MERVLVTGADGQLGVALRKSTVGIDGLTFYFTDIDTLDICDKSQMREFIQSRHIDIIINCAAYTAVDRAEDEPDICALINCDALRSIGELATETKTRVIHISTDYVFDGNGTRPYNETDATYPVSVYGKTKLAGEQALLSACENAIILRTAWLYSMTGVNFVKTMLRLGTERSTLNIVADQYGTPTYAADLAEVIKTILTSNRFIPGVYHYTNAGVCTWYDFAVKIFELTGIRCNVNPITTAEYPTHATRPAYSVLDKTKIIETFNIQIPTWEDSLAKCLRVDASTGSANGVESNVYSL